MSPFWKVETAAAAREQSVGATQDAPGVLGREVWCLHTEDQWDLSSDGGGGRADADSPRGHRIVKTNDVFRNHDSYGIFLVSTLACPACAVFNITLSWKLWED